MSDIVKKAIALRYEPDEDKAPVLIAKGKGYLAERIIKIAKDNNIYVHSDPELVGLLMGIDIADTIPPHLYQVVASVLAMAYRVNREMGRRKGLTS